MTCVEAIFRVKWRWLPHRFRTRLSPTSVLVRTPVTQMIIFNKGMLLLGWSHFLRRVSLRVGLSSVVYEQGIFLVFFSRLAYASVVVMRSFLFLHSTSSLTTFSSTLIKPCYNLLRAERLKERRMERQKSAKERRKALESKMARWKNSDQLEHSQGRD